MSITYIDIKETNKQKEANMSITKAQLKKLRTDMNKLLNDAGLGEFEFNVGNMSYGAEYVDIKVEAKLKGGKSKKETQLESMLSIYNLQVKGRNGEKLVGYNSRSYKYPFQYYDAKGTGYKCSLEDAKVIFR